MNIAQKVFFDSKASQISPFWRGHLFLFDKPQATAPSPSQGSKLLLVFLFVELIARSGLAAGSRWLTLAHRPWWPLVQVVTLVALGCWLVTSFARVSLSQLGLYSWRRWSKTEKSYFLQIIPIAVTVFSFFGWADLKVLWARPNLGEIGLFICVRQMLWGFYHEFLYRGVLQTELVRRWGARTGVLVSTVIFTFGPLHAYHFLIAQRHPSHLWMFAGIFAIGLFFAVIFQRSGNLWLIGVMHGIGDWFIDGLSEVLRMAR